MIEKANIKNLYPLSPSQKGLLFESMYESGESYFGQILFRLRGEVNSAWLQASWNATAARHDSLRTFFTWKNTPEPLQIVLRKWEIEFGEEDIQHLDEAAQEKWLTSWQAADRSRGFDLSRQVPQRIHLIRLAPDLCCMVWSFHHLLIDGWCLGTIFSGVFDHYAQLRNDLPQAQPAGRPYVEYIKWIGNQDEEEAENFWKDYLTHYERRLYLPGRRRAEGQPYDLGILHYYLSDAQTEGVAAFARQFNVTPNSFYQALWGLLLCRYNDVQDAVFGITVSGRPASIPGVEEIVGMFINTVPLRVQIGSDLPVGEWMQNLMKSANAATPYHYFSLATIQANSALQQGLFDEILVYENYPLEEGFDADAFKQSTGFFPESVDEYQQTNYGFNFLIVPEKKTHLIFKFNRVEYREEMVARLWDHLAYLIDQILEHPGMLVSDLQLERQEARLALARRLNPAPSVFPAEGLAALFAETVAAHPEAIALVNGETSISYAELNARANRLAHHLLDTYKLQPEQSIGLMLPRSAEMIVAMLAILKAGCAYVPLDAGHPMDRTRFIIADTGLQIMLTNSDHMMEFLELGLELFVMDIQESGLETSDSNPDRPVTGTQLAYIMYTSGTTGQPKGILTQQAGVVRLVRATNYTAPKVGDRIMQLSNYAFDGSTFDIYGALLNGASLYLVEKAALLSMTVLAEFIRGHKINMTFMTTALFNQLVDEAPELIAQFDKLYFGGQEASLRHVRTAMAHRKHAEALVHVYGPTEATTFATFHPVGELPVTADNLPIGRAISNTEVLVLDRQMRMVPQGVEGEICLSGPGLAAGYLNQPELTAAQFVPHPFQEAGLIYRTGDLGRWNENGELEFRGRRDTQVKIRGFRIELGEIENALLKHEDVRQVFAMATEADQATGSRELVAYLVCEADAELSVDGLRQFLKGKLPDYMIPAHFVELEALPLNANGKVDAQELPAPGTERLALGSTFAAARNEDEALLLEMIGELLGHAEVGIHDNYFSLGGDSIKAIQLIARLHQRGKKLGIKDVFEHPTVAEMALRLEAETPKKQTESGAGVVPLSPVQQWFVANYGSHPARHHFNQSFLLEAQERLAVGQLQAAVDGIMARHEILSSRLLREGGAFQFEIPEKAAPIPVHLLKVEAPEAIERSTEALQTGMDLENGPLVAVALIEAGDAQYIFFGIHHFVVDIVSWHAILDELRTALATRDGESVPANQTDTWKSWVQSLQEFAGSPAATESLRTWKGLLEGAPETSKGAYSADFRQARFTAGAEVTEQLRGAAHKAYRTEMNDLLLTALGQSLPGLTGGEANLIDMEGHGREQSIADLNLSQTVGWFTSVFPLVLQKNEGDLRRMIREMKMHLRGIPDRGVSYGILRYFHEEGASLACNADIGFNYLGEMKAGADGWLRFAEHKTASPVSPELPHPHALECIAFISEGQLQLDLHYEAERWSAREIEEFGATYLTQIEKLVRHCVAQETTVPVPTDFDHRVLSLEELDALGNKLQGGLAAVENIYRLTPMQEGMLFQQLKSPTDKAYFEQISFRFRGALNPKAMATAWEKLMQRHAILRTVFAWDTGAEYLQIVLKAPKLQMLSEDFRDLGPAEVEELIALHLEADRDRGFELDREPPVRILLLQLPDHAWHLTWSFHHILLDGWCLPIVMDELFRLYREAAENMPVELPPPAPFSRFIKWLEAQDPAPAAEFWKAYVADYDSVASLPKRSLGSPELPSQHLEHKLRLSRSMTSALQTLARQQQISFATLINVLWGSTLAWYNDQQDVILGQTVSGRPPSLPDVQRMVGLFINAVPLRVKFEADTPFEELLQNVHAQKVEAEAFHHFPLAQIQQFSTLQNQLIDHVVVMENYPIDEKLRSENESPLGKLEIEEVDAFQRTHFDFDLLIVPGTELSIRFRFNQNVYDKQVMVQIAEHVRVLAERVVNQPGIQMQDLLKLPVADQNWQTEGLNPPLPTALPGPDFIARFEAQAKANPNQAALRWKNEALTYGQLNARSNEIAHWLLANHELGADDRVGLMMQRSPDMVAAIIGVLKTGAAYVPVDLTYPEKRQAYMLEATACTAVISNLNEVSLAENPMLMKNMPSNLPDGDPGIQVPGTSLANIIFTSGSTGRPKAIAVTRDNHAAFIDWCTAEFAADEFDVVVGSSSYCFDLSVFDYMYPLSVGKAIRLVGSGLDLREALELEPKACLNTVPSAFALLLEDDAALARVASVGLAGEPIPLHFRDILHRHPHIRFRNVYGPSEDTVYGTCAFLAPDKPIYIGRPVQNESVYVLGKAGNLLPLGVPGELYLAGTGLARGYFGAPDLTAAAFLPNPFREDRMYRTGDLVRWVPGGELEFLGRVDQQVKIRGHRVEPGEVSVVLNQLPDIREAVVTIGKSPQGEPELRGWLVSDTEIDIRAIFSTLTDSLPGYLVPATIDQLEAIPRGSNGKLDAASLPEPKARTQRTASGEAWTDALDLAVRDVWEALLGYDSLRKSDDFFALGGHSILATHLVHRLEAATGIKLPLADVFSYPKLGNMCARMHDLQGGATTSEIVAGPTHGTFPLSYAQTRMWMLARKAPAEMPAYVLVGAYSLEGEWDAGALRQAAQGLSDRHASLRTTFTESMEGPVQRVLEQHPVDLEFISAENDLTEAVEACAAGLRTSLALPGERPGFALRIVSAQSGPSVLVIAIHHIVSDAWSLGLMMRDFRELYEAEIKQHSANLAPLTIQYSDYVHWQNEGLAGERYPAVRAWWKTQLLHATPDPGLPPRLAEGTGEAGAGFLEFHLDKLATSNFDAFGNSQGASMFISCFAVLSALVYRFTGRENLVFGYPSSGRENAQLREQVGFFVNQMPLAVSLKGDDTFREHLLQVRSGILGGMEHGEFPMDRIQSDLNLAPGQALYRLGLTWNQFADTGANSRSGLHLQPFPLKVTTSKNALWWDATVIAGQLVLRMNYDRAVYTEAELTQVGEAFSAVVLQISSAPHDDILIRDLDLGAAAGPEQTHLTTKYNF